MKKLTLSVAALSIALTTFGQTSNDSITFSKNEIVEMIITLEDILEWQQQDMDKWFDQLEKQYNEVQQNKYY